MCIVQKKIIILALFIYSSCFAQDASYLISDLNFRQFLEENHSDVLISDSLIDINACSLITSIDCSASDIQNLDGIQYFENLLDLNCSYNQLTQLVNLPPNLKQINTSHCVNLNVLGALPSSIEFIDCSYNQISQLPNLPLSLEQLYCSVNTLSSLPNLPINLTHLDCSFNNLTALPYLPANLALINCSYNQLTSLPDLPSDLGLIYNNPLNLFNNNIQCVGEYSDILEELLNIYPQCEDVSNHITQEIFLPEGWSLFSILGPTENMSLDTVLSSISDDVIMAKDNYGSVYFTEWNYNGVGDIIIGEGYQIKTSSSTLLSLNIELVEPEDNPITLSSGWNMIGYLRNISSAADMVLNELVESDNLLIAKDFSGAVFIPSWGFNGIGDMDPGRGYQIKVQESDLLHFLPNNMNY